MDLDLNTTNEKPKSSKTSKYLAVYKGDGDIFEALKFLGEDSSLEHRRKLAIANNVTTSNSSAMNDGLLELIKAGDYDLSIIVPMQDEIHDKYKEKLDNMKYNF